MAAKKEPDREPTPLDRLVRVLTAIEQLLAAGKDAASEAIHAWVSDLDYAVGIDPVDLRAAARVCGRKGIQYLGYDYDSYADVLYRDARLYYDCLHELLHDYIEDKPSGSLSHYGGDEDIANRWGKFLPKLRNAVAEPFPPGEIERVAALAQRELEQGANLPPPPGPTRYDTSMAARDGLTEASLQAHQAELPGYRDGNKRARKKGQRFTDVLHWQVGEAPDRFATKIGGVPYRPAALPWPTREDGTPLSFLGQICFADSADLVSADDDVLLVFAVEPHGYTAGAASPEPGLRFEWYPLGLTRLVEANNLPATSWKLLPCFATCERVAEKDGPVEGPKIGGVPYCIQYEFTTEGEFLATLGQLHLSTPPEQERLGYEALTMADDGLLSLYSDLGDLEWDFQSY